MRRRARFARRIGLDRNPLRRRIDRFGACLRAALLVVFLAGAPLVSMMAAAWSGHSGNAQLRAQREWHRVSAVLLHSSPVPAVYANGLNGGAWEPARWTAPDGQARTGRIEVATGLKQGQRVPLWVTAAGAPTGNPLTHAAMVARVVLAAFIAPLLLAVAIAIVAGILRWVLDRRRLAGWETAWASVGPQWTRRFWSKG
jgi:hypothetical protein